MSLRTRRRNARLFTKALFTILAIERTSNGIANTQAANKLPGKLQTKQNNEQTGASERKLCLTYHPHRIFHQMNSKNNSIRSCNPPNDKKSNSEKYFRSCNLFLQDYFWSNDINYLRSLFRSGNAFHDFKSFLKTIFRPVIFVCRWYISSFSSDAHEQHVQGSKRSKP